MVGSQSRFRAAGENRRSRTHSCNLARDWRTLKKEVRNFYSDRL
jgi:hypothetical protein